MKLTQTRIVAKNVQTLARFYQQIMGIAPVGDEQRYVEFHAIGNSLAICSQDTMDLHGAGGATAASNRSIILDFQVEDVDQERLRLQQQQLPVEWVMEPTNQPWGNRSMLFRDPDGNLINFFTPLPKS